jgi:hypothetical protein
MWKSIPRSAALNWYLMEAEWYGRYGAQFDWTWKVMDMPAIPRAGPATGVLNIDPNGREKRRVLYMRGHMPYEAENVS